MTVRRILRNILAIYYLHFLDFLVAADLLCPAPD